MVWNSIKTHVALIVAVFAIGVNSHCMAQATNAPLADTPSQRWIPPPRAYPTQQENQAKLLSRLRDSLLQGDTTNESNSSRLSDSDVQSLKEAMKQFKNYFPEGLTPESLDSIPPELISKALSNPELVKQARELAEKYSKENEPKRNEDQQSNRKGSSSEKTSGKNTAPQNPSNPSNPKNQAPSKQRDLNQEEQIDKSSPQVDPKGKDFTDLVNKLRSTQQNYEHNQNELNNASDQTKSPSVKKSSATNPPANRVTPPRELESPFPSSGSTQSPSSLSPEPKSPKQPEPSPQRQKPSTNSQQPTAPKPSDSATPGVQRSDTNSGPRRPESSLRNENADQAAKTGDLKTGTQSGSSMDIRSELDRRGFGPTMQKIVEEAQRTSQAARPKTTPASQSETGANTETKTGEEGNQESKQSPAITPPAKQPTTSPSRATEPSPRNQNANSTVSKSMQKTGDYLNKIWTEATKSSAASPKPTPPRSSPNRNSTSTPPARPEAISIPNPFNVQFLQAILLVAGACLIGYFVLKIKFNKEQERRETMAAQWAPKIDEIESRDDVVRAFHALAKQRLQAVQSWWTCGQVAERFQEKLPEHAQPIRTLSGLYEQARYYPAEHKLTADQIQSAKLALKQCKV